MMLSDIQVHAQNMYKARENSSKGTDIVNEEQRREHHRTRNTMAYIQISLEQPTADIMHYLLSSGMHRVPDPGTLGDMMVFVDQNLTSSVSIKSDRGRRGTSNGARTLVTFLGGSSSENAVLGCIAEREEQCSIVYTSEGTPLLPAHLFPPELLRSTNRAAAKNGSIKERVKIINGDVEISLNILEDAHEVTVRCPSRLASEFLLNVPGCKTAMASLATLSGVVSVVDIAPVSTEALDQPVVLPPAGSESERSSIPVVPSLCKDEEPDLVLTVEILSGAACSSVLVQEAMTRMIRSEDAQSVRSLTRDCTFATYRTGADSCTRVRVRLRKFAASSRIRVEDIFRAFLGSIADVDGIEISSELVIPEDWNSEFRMMRGKHPENTLVISGRESPMYISARQSLLNTASLSQSEFTRRLAA
jgi:hypothetical protein